MVYLFLVVICHMSNTKTGSESQGSSLFDFSGLISGDVTVEVTLYGRYLQKTESFFVGERTDHSLSRFVYMFLFICFLKHWHYTIRIAVHAKSGPSFEPHCSNCFLYNV